MQRETNRRYSQLFRAMFWLILAAGLWTAVSGATTAKAEAPAPAKAAPASVSEAENHLGIKILGLHPTAGGYMLDLRYRVIDPIKAAPILDKNKKAFLLDEASGKALPVPVTKSGSLRQSTMKPEKGRIYFILFSNPGKMVKEGARTTLIIGDFKLKGIQVATTAPAASKKDPGSSPPAREPVHSVNLTDRNIPPNLFTGKSSSSAVQ